MLCPPTCLQMTRMELMHFAAKGRKKHKAFDTNFENCHGFDLRRQIGSNSQPWTK